MIYWTKKNSFKKISKGFIKNDFEWVISIYLFTKYFLQMMLKKNYLYSLYQKNLLKITYIKRNKKIDRNTNFSKVNYKNVSIFFFIYHKLFIVWFY